MRIVRTTMKPDEELEVEDAEYLDLSRQGLLIEEDEEEPETEPAHSKPATRKAPAQETLTESKEEGL